MPHNIKTIRGTTPEIEQAAKQLRKNLTPAEAKLWAVLQKRQLLGLKFRCQHPVGQFILDFYCPANKLVIEVDGESHRHKKTYDQVRTEKLQDHGYQVLRFSNDEILQNLPTVLLRITRFIEANSP